MPRTAPARRTAFSARTWLSYDPLLGGGAHRGKEDNVALVSTDAKTVKNTPDYHTR
jgi:hypothetical protein